MRYIVSILLCVWMLYLPHTAEAQAEQFAEIRESIETAVDSLQPEILVKVNTKLTSLSDHENPQVRKYAYYYRGYTNYRLQSSFPNVSEDQKEKYLDEAVRMLKKAVSLDESFAEAQGLLASCYGIKASGFFAGMKYGPKSDATMKQAKSLAPKNPRVILLDAIGTLYKPSMFGGSTEGAIEGFKQAAELFNDGQPPNDFAPRWGNAEVYAWLGQGYVQAEKYKQARQAYQSALEVKPGYPWVKSLMIKLNQKAQ